MQRRTKEELKGILSELTSLSTEVEWVEFKKNKAMPEEIGEYISALSNSASLLGKVNAYLVWGVDNESHDIVGTTFKPKETKIGNEEIENWLLRQLSPKIDFSFHEVHVTNHNIIILEIDAAYRHPVQFAGSEYIRIGSYKKRLKDYPEKERELWRVFDKKPFEFIIAKDRLEDLEVLKLINVDSYFDLLHIGKPVSTDDILNFLEKDKLIQKCESGGWNITNIGAMLFAVRLDDFPALKRKATRVVQYKGKDRTDPIREQEAHKGYASGFSGLIRYIMTLIPSSEKETDGIRRPVTVLPETAIRELVANALIHQDFFMTGTGPLVELFSNRVEITNPGRPIVAVDRLIDNPPQSRNENLASMMRRIGICEERGSGIDKVILVSEALQLPPPLFEAPGDFMRSVVFSPRPLSQMDKEERIRACYQHACLKYVQREYLTNASLRERFGIEGHNKAIATRLIKDSVEAGKIVLDPATESRKYARYMPEWAGQTAIRRSAR